MKLFKKIIIVIVILGAISIIFLTWYAVQYGMDKAQPFEINDKGLEQRVLIATQGSKFKSAVVEKVVTKFKSLPVYISVIDVGQLSEVNEADWSAIVILHTWENFKPQKEAKLFVERSSKVNLIVVSTSGSGTSKIESVDGITAASLPEEEVAVADEIVQRLKSILNM